MPFAKPTPFKAALQSTAVKRILPTSLTSAQLQDIDADIRERARFSAQTVNTFYLSKLDETIDKVLQPVEVIRAGKRVTEGMGMIEAKRELEAALRAIDYTPRKPGTIEDLGSDARLNLVIDTNVRMAQGYGNFAQGMDPDILDAFPAQELFRGEDRVEPRDWPQRWSDAGGQFFDGRMIASKTDPIWNDISAFGIPYPPFDFNSGMEVQDVDRQEAEELGVIAPGEEMEPEEVGFNDDLEMSADQFGKSFLAQLKEDLGSDYKVSKGVLRLKNRPTPAQKLAGNFPMVHAKFQGIPLSIEVTRGDVRIGVSDEGEETWSVVMPCDYGYIKGTTSTDGDQIDCFVGQNMSANTVFVLEQLDARTGKFDECKALLGFSSREEAVSNYLASFSDGKGRLRMGPMASIPIRAFKSWIKGHSQRGPITSRALKNDCGTGSGGFKPGNECGKGGGGSEETGGKEGGKSDSGHEAAGVPRTGPLTSEQLSKVKSIDHEQAVETLASRVPGFNDVTGAERQRIREEIRGNTKEYTPEALKGLAENVDHMQFGTNQDAVDAGLWKGQQKFEGVAFYNQRSKMLFMTHAGRDDVDPRKTLSHELAHALDRTGQGDNIIMGGHSLTPKFSEVYKSELASSSKPIGSYAASSPAEGFAEAVAYVHQHGLKAARDKIPKTTEYLVKEKVVKE